jgi:rubrerythrin
MRLMTTPTQRHRPRERDVSAEEARGERARPGTHPEGPQDHALYACSCGYVFEAEVSTRVSCPHCGETQAW